MDWEMLDVASRLSAVTVLLFLAWLLFRQRREIGVPALLFLPMALCLSGFVIGNTPDPALRLSGAPTVIAHFASGCTVVFLWWFCLSCFDPRFRPTGAVLVVGVGWIVIACVDRATGNSAPALSRVLVVIGYGIVAHLVWHLLAEREGDLVERRHDARAMAALLLGSLLLIDLTVDLVLGFDWRPPFFSIGQNALVLGFSVWLGSRVLLARSDVLGFVAAPRPILATPMADAEPRELPDSAELRQRLTALIDIDRIHLDPELTFACFVERMNAPERAVRKLVNHELGFDHFRSFLSHYRVVEACRLLSDPGRSADKLIGIALDSGFASLPSFNRVFRAEVGCTPSEYRERAHGHLLLGHGDGLSQEAA